MGVPTIRDTQAAVKNIVGEERLVCNIKRASLSHVCRIGCVLEGQYQILRDPPACPATSGVLRTCATLTQDDRVPLMTCPGVIIASFARNGVCCQFHPRPPSDCRPARVDTCHHNDCKRHNERPRRRAGCLHHHGRVSRGTCVFAPARLETTPSGHPSPVRGKIQSRSVSALAILHCGWTQTYLTPPG